MSSWCRLCCMRTASLTPVIGPGVQHGLFIALWAAEVQLGTCIRLAMWAQRLLLTTGLSGQSCCNNTMFLVS